METEPFCHVVQPHTVRIDKQTLTLVLLAQEDWDATPLFRDWAKWEHAIRERRNEGKPAPWELVLEHPDATRIGQTLLAQSSRPFLSYRGTKRHLTVGLLPWVGYEPELLFHGSGLTLDLRKTNIKSEFVRVHVGEKKLVLKANA